MNNWNDLNFHECINTYKIWIHLFSGPNQFLKISRVEKSCFLWIDMCKQKSIHFSVHKGFYILMAKLWIIFFYLAIWHLNRLNLLLSRLKKLIECCVYVFKENISFVFIMESLFNVETIWFSSSVLAKVRRTTSWQNAGSKAIDGLDTM